MELTEREIWRRAMDMLNEIHQRMGVELVYQLKLERLAVDVIAQKHLQKLHDDLLAAVHQSACLSKSSDSEQQTGLSPTGEQQRGA